MSRRPNIVSTIKDVFENTSGFDLDEFDNDTTFFEMGLDSLVLTQTATALKKEFDLEVTFRQLLEETPNVDTLADFLDSNLPDGRFVPEVDNKEEAPLTAQKATPAPPASAPVVDTPYTAATSATAQTPANAQTSVVTTTPPASQPVQPTPIQVNLPVAHGNGAQAIIQSQLQLMAAPPALFAMPRGARPFRCRIVSRAICRHEVSRPGHPLVLAARCERWWFCHRGFWSVPCSPPSRRSPRRT